MIREIRRRVGGNSVLQIHISNSLLLLILGTPLVYSDAIADGIVATKTCWFLFFSGLLFLSQGVFGLRAWKYTKVCYTWLDMSVVLFLAYSLLNGSFHDRVLLSVNNLEIAGLLGAYLIAKEIADDRLKWLIVRFFLFLLFAQLVIATLQFFLLIPSFNSNFVITGLFHNPGPFSICIAALAAISFSTYLFTEASRFKMLTALLFAGTLPILWITASLSAWIGLLASLLLISELRYSPYRIVVSWMKVKKVRVIILPFMLLLISLSFNGLYSLKKDSSDGRLLIWKSSFSIANKHFINGVGALNYPVALLRHQEKYFNEHPARKEDEGRLAGISLYAFNDGIQFFAEGGILGLIFFSLIVLNIGRYLLLLKKLKSLQISSDKLAVGSLAAVAVIVVSGLTSYPLQVLPLKIMFFASLAFISADINKLTSTWSTSSAFKASWTKGVFFGVLGTIQLYFASSFYKAYYHLKQIEENHYQGNYLSLLKPYDWVLKNCYNYPLLKADCFLINKRYSLAIKALEEGKCFSPDINIYYLLGDIYKLNKNYEKSEEQYLFVSNAVPNLLKPHYLLAKLYYDTEQTSKWQQKAEFIINFKPKGYSITTSTMVDEIRYLYYNKGLETSD